MKRTVDIFLILAITLPGIAAAWDTWDEPWEGGVRIVEEWNNKRGIGTEMIYGINNGPGALQTGDAVLWSATTITVVATATGSSSMTVADSLANDGICILLATMGASSSGTITITGTDQHGRTRTSYTAFTSKTSIIIGGAPGELWNTVTAVGTDVTTTTLTLTAYPINGVKKNAADDSIRETVAGIVVCGNSGWTDSTISINEQCLIATSGVVQARCADTAIVPGDKLATDAGGGPLDETSATDNTVLGIALSPAVVANQLIWMYLYE